MGTNKSKILITYEDKEFQLSYYIKNYFQLEAAILKFTSAKRSEIRVLAKPGDVLVTEENFGILLRTAKARLHLEVRVEPENY
jgi:hypothetical protein